MAKKLKLKRETVYDLMERANSIITKIHEDPSLLTEKEEIIEIGNQLNYGAKLTDVMTKFEAWLSSACSRFPDDEAAKKVLEDLKALVDSNPHNEWSRG